MHSLVVGSVVTSAVVVAVAAVADSSQRLRTEGLWAPDPWACSASTAGPIPASCILQCCSTRRI